MGGMTIHAVHGRSLNQDMGLPESIPVGFMTFRTQSLLRLVQQRRLAGSVRLVATETIPGGWGMGPLGFHLLLDFLVAGKAEIRTGGQQQHLETGFMGTVAAGAGTGAYGLMGTSGGLQIIFNLLMTAEAQRILTFNDHTRKIAGMGSMAILTGSLFEGWMQTFSVFFAHHGFVALGT
jgi:hypothetical protein